MSLSFIKSARETSQMLAKLRGATAALGSDGYLGELDLW